MCTLVYQKIAKRQIVICGFGVAGLVAMVYMKALNKSVLINQAQEGSIEISAIKENSNIRTWNDS